MLKTFGKYLGRFALVNLVAFILFYVSGYIIMNDAVEYVRYFIGETIDFALPVVTAALVAIAMAKRGFSALTLGVAAAIGRLVYLYPTMYLEFVVNQNLTSIDALLVSVPFSVGFALAELLYSMLLVFVIHLIGGKLAQKHKRSFEQATDSARSAFDFSNEVVVSVFFAGLISFVINLTLEVVSVVEFLTEYAGNYQMSEIIFMAVSFVMILASLLATQVVIFKIKNKIDESTLEDKNAKL